MRLVEVRLLDGPNVYHLEPAVKVEVAVGRRRTWYGQRMPGRHAIVRLRARVPRAQAPGPVARLADWVSRLHRLSDADAWLASDRHPSAVRARTRVPVTIHRSSDPGHWIVAFPWREGERAETLAGAAFRLTESVTDAADLSPTRGKPGGRLLQRSLEAIAAAATTPPTWVRDAQRRVPVISISGTNGKSTTTRMIAHIVHVAGRHVGSTTSDGVLVDEAMVEEGDLTGPYGARTVLGHPDVEVAVLETARGGLLLRGLGYESNDVAVLTNVSSDHMDLQGLHTLPELAEVKATIALVTRRAGLVVLNAEDPLVASAAHSLHSRVCYFAMSPAAPPARGRVDRHVASGGMAMVQEDGWIVELRGERRRRIVPILDVPATVGGAARHNIANALAAAAAARGVGVSLAAVARGLRTFKPTSAQAPGRLNMYRSGERVVIVDFAHNEAGVGAALEVAEAIVGDRSARADRAWLSVIVGTAGDRPDDTLHAVGRLAGKFADEIAIKETLAYLRGRTRQSVIGEIRAGIAASGRGVTDVPVYEDEVLATYAELTTPGRLAAGAGPGVLLVLCHSDRGRVEGTLEKLGFEPLDTDELVGRLPLGSPPSRPA